MLNPRLSKALCVLTSALALVAISGCGGDDNDEQGADTNTTAETTGDTTEETTESSGGDVAQYKKEFQAAGTDFKEAAEAASAEVQQATDTAGKVQALEKLKDVVIVAADDFEALDPPADVQADNDKLVSQFRDVADEVDAVKNALQSGDQAAADAAAKRLEQAETAIGKTLDSIESKVEG